MGFSNFSTMKKNSKMNSFNTKNKYFNLFVYKINLFSLLKKFGFIFIMHNQYFLIIHMIDFSNFYLIKKCSKFL